MDVRGIGLRIAVVAAIAAVLVAPPPTWPEAAAEVERPASFAEAAATVRAALISIRIPAPAMEEEDTGAAPGVDASDAEYFRWFLDRLFRAFPTLTLGAGVIVHPAGIAVTSAEVVDADVEFEVALSDGTVIPATVAGMDRRTDLAVMRLEGAGRVFPFARFADSDAVRQGDWVIALGVSDGLDATVTAGIVSATGSEAATTPLAELLQTDAAIGPGNAGGPLVNARGAVVGIVTALGAEAGIGLAVPANTARRIAPTLLEKGKIARGWLGISVQSLTMALAESFNAVGTAGVLVSEVVAEGPAARAGVRPGDILTVLNGRPLRTWGDLDCAVARSAPGDVVRIRLRRDGEQQMVTVTLDEEPMPPPPPFGF